ncbi:hypothetical protein K3495_g14747 [Podosphaera aphanis]|nr:hypothetical protein K3495_g14747 [Podosphaera aphanis]
MLLPFNEKFLWAEAANTYIYTKNRLAHGAVNRKTPYEAFYGKKPSILNFQPFGRAEKGIFVGYTRTSQQYRIFAQEKRRICVSADVEFKPFIASKLNADRTPPSSLPQPERVQEIPPVTVTLSTLKNGSGEDYYLSNLPREQGSSNASEMSSHQQLHETVPSTAEMLSNHSEQAEITQSTRPRRSVRPRVIENIITGDWWRKRRGEPTSGQPGINNPSNLNRTETAIISILEVPEPRSYHEAKFSVHWDEWKIAFDNEMESFAENDVWDVVPRPEGRKIVSGECVCKVKGNAQGDVERFKARYVAKGFSQIQGLDFDETYAPVVRFDSLRILLAIAAHKRWTPRQLDIKTAFLYGVLKEEIFMELP